ncbi:hypothetical protein J4447_02975 [Candidatus Pacearchaeota archaeon]|nr:hypothetical protein [Candidatus Pacearchaeota archaeon]
MGSLADLLWKGFCAVDDFLDKLLINNEGKELEYFCRNHPEVKHVQVLGHEPLRVIIDESIERRYPDPKSERIWLPHVGAVRVYYKAGHPRESRQEGNYR